MFRTLKLFVVIILCISSCYDVPKTIPRGSWNYKLLVNGVEVGTAVLSNQVQDGNYISSTEFKMKVGNITTVSKEVVTETSDFKPLKLESYNKIETGSNVHVTDIKATFKGREVELISDNNKTTYKIKKDFILDGNYSLSKLIEGGFKEGLEVKAGIYHPSIELEDPVTVKTEVVGIEDVMIDGKGERLIHVAHSIENIKNIDLYYGSDGIVRKVIIQMLNLKIELIKI